MLKSGHPFRSTAREWLGFVESTVELNQICSALFRRELQQKRVQIASANRYCLDFVLLNLPALPMDPASILALTCANIQSADFQVMPRFEDRK